jgi:hypothetical protein
MYKGEAPGTQHRLRRQVDEERVVVEGARAEHGDLVAGVPVERQ